MLSHKGKSPDTTSLVIAITIILVFLAIVLAGGFFYHSQERLIKERVTTELSAIAVLKADQITAWRAERLGDAGVLAENRILSSRVKQYLAAPDPADREDLLALFRQIKTSYNYRNVQLVDRGGVVRLSLDPAETYLNPELQRELAGSLADNRIVLTDIYRETAGDTPEIFAIAPLILTSSGTRETVGGIILTIDPSSELYPLIQLWPVPSESAETLLVRQEGDRVLFLNRLRHNETAAFNLTIPLSQEAVPAVMAVKGITGVFEGRDYRDVDVISVLTPVTGSPWFMVAKIDTAEAYASWRSRSVLIVVLVAGSFVVLFVLAALIWQRRQKTYFQSLYAAETERSQEEQQNRERVESLLHLAGMEKAGELDLADFVLDAGCRLTGSTAAFVGTLTGDESAFDLRAWTGSAGRDRSAAPSPGARFPLGVAGVWGEAVRRRGAVIENEYPADRAGTDSLPGGQDPIRRFVSVPVFEGERIVMVCTVANKGSPYTTADVNNLTLLAQGLWKHLQKRGAAKALRAMETRFRQFFERESSYCYLISPDGRILDLNSAAVAALEYTSKDDLIGKPLLPTIYAPESQERATQLFNRWRETGRIENEEMVIQTRTGRRRNVLLSVSAVYGEEGEILHSVSVQTDFTERKKAEEELLRKNTDLEAAFEEITASDEEIKANYDELARIQQALTES